MLWNKAINLRWEMSQKKDKSLQKVLHVLGMSCVKTDKQIYLIKQWFIDGSVEYRSIVTTTKITVTQLVAFTKALSPPLLL